MVLRRLAGVLAGAACLAGGAAGAAVPTQILDAVNGRVVGWAPSPGGFAAVYLDRRGGDWCGLSGASWWIALVSPKTERVSAARRLGPAMCGNSLAWVKAGRFSDGRHAEVAFMLWATPSLGATTYIYRVGGGRLTRLASFAGDVVSLGRGTVTTRFENPGRNPDGKLRETYRFEGGRYRLVGN